MRLGTAQRGHKSGSPSYPCLHLNALRLEHATGSRGIKARLPELYDPLIVTTGKEGDTRSVRFDEVRG